MSRFRLPVVLVTLLLLSACSFRASVTSEASGSASPTTRSTTAGAPSGGATPSAPSGATTVAAGTTSPPNGRCHTGDLAGSLGGETAGAGQRYATLVLRNTGGRSCTLHGFGGLGLAAAGGAALPATQVRTGGPATTVVLPPGGSARSALHWGAVNGPGDSPTGDCQPSPATLRVIPPDETDPLSVAWTFGPVCEGGKIEQQPYTA